LKRWFWIWGPAVAQMGIIFAASSVPNLTALPGDISDHTGHFVGYALLGALMLRALASARWAGITLGAGAAAVLLTAAYGATDEWHQGFVAGRSPALDDWIADLAGAVAGVGLILAIASLRRRRARVARDV
jgi:VanZ family protein